MQTALLKYSVNIFEENITQELAHYFYGLTPDVPDATHAISAEEGEAITLVIGLIGEFAGWVMTHIGRLRLGGVNKLGMRG